MNSHGERVLLVRIPGTRRPGSGWAADARGIQAIAAGICRWNCPLASAADAAESAAARRRFVDRLKGPGLHKVTRL